MLSLGPPVASGRWAIGAVVTLALVYFVAIRAPDTAIIVTLRLVPETHSLEQPTKASYQPRQVL